MIWNVLSKSFLVGLALVVVSCAGPPCTFMVTAESGPSQKFGTFKGAIDDAIYGNEERVRRFFETPASQLPEEDYKDEVISKGLYRAHHVAKELYYKHNLADAAHRVALTFDLISFAELGFKPQSDNVAANVKNWIAACKKALLQPKEYVGALSLYGLNLQANNHDTDAVEVFRSILSADPERDEAYLSLADSLWKLGNKEEALPLYEKYKTLMAKENLAGLVPTRVGTALAASYSPPLGSNSGGGDTVNSSDAQKSELSAYTNEVERRVRTRWHSPKENAELLAVARFKIDKNGRISEITLTQPSNVDDFDKAAISAIQGVEVPPPPAGVPDSMHMNFTFNYHTYQQGDTSHELVWRWKQRVQTSDTADNRIGLAQAYEQIKNFKAAYDQLDKALEMSPGNEYYKTLLEQCKKAEASTSAQ